MSLNCYLNHYTINSIHYAFTKSEICIWKEGKPHTQKSIKLNEIDSYCEYICNIPVYSLVWLIIYLCGFLTALGFIFIGHALIHTNNAIRISLGVLTYFIVGYYFLNNYNREWRFYYLFQPGIAFTIKSSRKTEKEARKLAEDIIREVKNSDKSNQHIVAKLARYNLLTEREYDLMSAKLVESKISQTQSKIIDIRERLK